jgi:hypothetical protein
MLWKLKNVLMDGKFTIEMYYKDIEIKLEKGPLWCSRVHRNYWNYTNLKQYKFPGLTIPCRKDFSKSSMQYSLFFCFLEN